MIASPFIAIPFATVTERRPALLACVLLALTLSAGGCAGPQNGGPMSAMASSSLASSSLASPAMTSVTLASAGTQAVAFESVDGPPPQVFDRYVRVLDNEAKARNVAVVSRSAAAGYRIRGYLSAQVSRGKTVIAWVWDVYDANQERVLRLTGEESVGKFASRDAWSAADEQLLRKIAQSGMTSLAAWLGAPAPAEPPAVSPGRGPAIASLTPPADAFGPSEALAFSAH